MTLFTVNQLAKASGVTVRTLHHYDEIGLLSPKSRSESGYRLYGKDELLRLQQILMYRELGLPLEGIAEVLQGPDMDYSEHLQRHRLELLKRKERIEAMLLSLDKALELTLNNHGEMKMSDLFAGFEPEQYKEEAAKAWGDTDAWKVSQSRTGKYADEQWKIISSRQNELYLQAANLLKAGVHPGESGAMDAAEALRLFIDEWFYPCSKDMHVNLADMYESDARFAKNIDKVEPGLTSWLVQAIRANSAR